MKQNICTHSIIIALALSFSAFAEDKAREPKSSDTTKAADSTKKQTQFMGPITAVSREEKTITIDDAKMGKHKLHIGDTTKLMRGDKTATWDDLKVGAKVEGTCTGEKDTAHAEKLTIKE